MFQPSKRLTAFGSALVLVLAMSAVASCSGPSGTPSPATSSGTPTGPTSGSASSTATAAVTADAAEFCGAGSAIHYDRSAFQLTPRIDNKWFPLKPGMQYTTKGTVKSADGTSERTVVHSVTGLTKVIDGVKTLVMWDRDYFDGQLVESELAFFAQTEKGAVWLFGEYPEEYENGTFTGAPRTFISGISKAQAGIAMQDQPVTGTPGYVQAHAPDVGFLDCGTVFKQHERVCVPTACYDDVLIVDEYNPLEPSVGHQQKLYSAGTGLVKVTAVGGVDQESLDLVKAEALADSALSEINRQALELDGHAYQVSASVYATTPRAEVSSPGSAG